MYKRIMDQCRSAEDEQEFFDYNQLMSDSKYRDDDVEYFNCTICDYRFIKTDYHLQHHINSAIHKKLVGQFRLRYNNAVKIYKLSIYKTTLGRRRRKLAAFKQLYQFE